MLQIYVSPARSRLIRKLVLLACESRDCAPCRSRFYLDEHVCLRHKLDRFFRRCVIVGRRGFLGEYGTFDSITEVSDYLAKTMDGKADDAVGLLSRFECEIDHRNHLLKKELQR